MQYRSTEGGKPEIKRRLNKICKYENYSLKCKELDGERNSCSKAQGKACSPFQKAKPFAGGQ